MELTEKAHKKVSLILQKLGKIAVVILILNGAGNKNPLPTLHFYLCITMRHTKQAEL